MSDAGTRRNKRPLRVAHQVHENGAQNNSIQPPECGGPMYAGKRKDKKKRCSYRVSDSFHHERGKSDQGRGKTGNHVVQVGGSWRQQVKPKIQRISARPCGAKKNSFAVRVWQTLWWHLHPHLLWRWLLLRFRAAALPGAAGWNRPPVRGGGQANSKSVTRASVASEK